MDKKIKENEKYKNKKIMKINKKKIKIKKEEKLCSIFLKKFASYDTLHSFACLMHAYGHAYALLRFLS